MNWLDNLPLEPVNKLLNPIADSLGQGIGGIFYWIFQKPIKFKIIKEAEVQDLANKTAERLQNIPEENRDTSNRGLLMKTIEEAQYAISEGDLRTMFANLIASSADNRKNEVISPRFPTILSQISPKDAKALQIIHNQPGYQLPFGFLKIEYNDANRGSRKIAPYLALAYDNSVLPANEANLNNLVSLGIINCKEDFWLTADHYTKQYELIKEVLFNSNIPIEDRKDGKLKMTKGIINTTDFGFNFFKCIF